MKKWIIIKLISLLLLSVSCNGQQPNEKLSDKKNGIVGDSCDGCELMYIGMPEKYNLPIQVQAGMKKARN